MFLADLKRLEEKYPRELVVIGVHSAKFTAEREPENIRQAILRPGDFTPRRQRPGSRYLGGVYRQRVADARPCQPDPTSFGGWTSRAGSSGPMREPFARGGETARSCAPTSPSLRTSPPTAGNSILPTARTTPSAEQISTLRASWKLWPAESSHPAPEGAIAAYLEENLPGGAKTRVSI